MFCETCGVIDENYDENEEIIHQGTIKHICNQILADYKSNKKHFSRNRENIFILGGVKLLDKNGATLEEIPMIDHHKIRVYVKPKHGAKFSFNIRNESKYDDLLIVGIQLAHPQPQFEMCDHPYVFGGDPYIWDKKSSIKEEISVKFAGSDVGQYEMPIMFTFRRTSTNKNLIFIREMVVMVQENPVPTPFPKSPYAKEALTRADNLIKSSSSSFPHKYRIPPLLKILLPRGIEEKALEGLKQTPEEMDKLRLVLMATRAIFDEGITRDNYMQYFHNLLWWEEIIVKINLRKYNMTGVSLKQKDGLFVLEVPGLAEKRPSLLRGDRVFLQPQNSPQFIFECVIRHIDDIYIHLSDVDQSFMDHFTPDAVYDVRFILSRVPFERCHEAVACVYSAHQALRLFPEPGHGAPRVNAINKFYNTGIAINKEQRSAVEHIVAGSSGRAPYIVFGPPGTGKTMTIVEAIVQLVARNPRNRVLVCTDSNMAADHIALMLLKYKQMLNITNFILRANSRSREWSVMPEALHKVSNGTSYERFTSLDNAYVSMYRVVVTTLLHAATYASKRSQSKYKLQMSHLFIDEAAQASEPHTLVPITGLLAPTGQLVLAGDPEQLGPVCISKEASGKGLGKSLLERLREDYVNLYDKNPIYITMLVKNFRSDPDILMIPNKLFYKNELIPLAPADPLSRTSILGLPGGDRAIVFHALHSREQKMGNAPSFFNEKELEMLKRYVKSLIDEHNVQHEDIGIIAPYIRQVYRMKAWLVSQEYDKIDVGTVEAFQGKEKRVILVSTVRANCRLLEYDAKYALGFLVDDKRFNVTITRAKAKLVIIGNPACLTRDTKWRMYMECCKEYNCYHGVEYQQLERTSTLLDEVARVRFNKCGLTQALKERNAETAK